MVAQSPKQSNAILTPSPQTLRCSTFSASPLPRYYRRSHPRAAL